MEESVLASVVSQLKLAKRVLVALPKNLTIDVVAAAVALRQGLLALQKTVVLASSGEYPERAQFLPGSETIHPLQQSSTDLVFSVDTSKAAVQDMTYEVFPGKTLIYVRAKDGGFSPADVVVSSGELPFDIVIVLGSATLEHLGELFTNHAQLFYALPRINIDINPLNEHFGTTNYVPVTSSSLCEPCYRLLVALGEPVSVPPAATALLAGILATTNSLQNQQTTPESFAIVADLIAAGADHQLVVKHLFKTERLSFLKLFGRVLARLKTYDHPNFACSVLLRSDFEKTGERIEVTANLLEELLEQVSGLQALSIVVPQEQKGSLVFVAAGPGFLQMQFSNSIASTEVQEHTFDNGARYSVFTTPESVEKLETILPDIMRAALVSKK